MGARHRICLVRPTCGVLSETFIRAHEERLPAEVTVVHGALMPGAYAQVGSRPIVSRSLIGRGLRKVVRTWSRRDWDWELERSYVEFFRGHRFDAILAEYGPTGVRVMNACRDAHVPLVVHFHGYDASMYSVLSENATAYATLFERAAAVVAVSKLMQKKLIALGAPAEKVHYVPYGIDCAQFTGARPADAGPVFLAVGRFVEKKAPYLTLLAFANVHQECPAAQLRMVGEGPLLGPCRDLAAALGIQHAVTFLGPQPHQVIMEEMRGARCFVQHSIEASSGDCEGTPLAVLEAGASGLPVVATRHAGIPDVVVHGETGFLVDERDVRGMAEQMSKLVSEPGLADVLGRNAAAHVRQNYTSKRSIDDLWKVISGSFGRGEVSGQVKPDEVIMAGKVVGNG